MLKIKVDMTHIFIVNFSLTVTDRANNTITDTSEVAYWLSNGVFKSDLELF